MQQVWSEMELRYASSPECTLELLGPSRDKEWPAEVCSAHFNSAPPEFFRFQNSATTAADLSDVNWGNLSDFYQLPLVPQMALYNFYPTPAKRQTPVMHLRKSFSGITHWILKLLFLIIHVWYRHLHHIKEKYKKKDTLKLCCCNWKREV